MGKRTMKDGKKCGEWIEDGKTKICPLRPRRQELAPSTPRPPYFSPPTAGLYSTVLRVRCGAPVYVAFLRGEGAE